MSTKQKIPLRVVGLVLVLIVATCLVAAQQPSASPSPKKSEPTDTPAESGEDAGDYTVISSVEFGYRGLSVDGDLNKYSSIIRKIGTTAQVPVIDFRKSFLDYDLLNNKENKDRGVLTSDGVHLNLVGNQFVADKMYTALTGK